MDQQPQNNQPFYYGAPSATPTNAYQPGQGWQPMPQQPLKKKIRKPALLGCGCLSVIALFIAIVAVSTSASTATPTSSKLIPPTTVVNNSSSKRATAKPTATPKPAPTASPAQIEEVYKASTTTTSIANLDKDGSADQGNDVHFTCTIVNFVKDDTGNTAAVNVTDASTSSVVQVLFTSGTDVTRLNTGDVLEVWGVDQGASSGTNAFGATIQEVGVQAQYMKDKTTGYSVDS